MQDTLETIANQSQFGCRVKGLANDTFSLQSFRSHHHALSKHYQYTLKLLASQIIKPTAVLNKSAQLIQEWGKDRIYVHGLISRFCCLGPSLDGKLFSYEVTLESPLLTLAKCCNIRVFLRQNVLDIVKTVLKMAGWAESTIIDKTHQLYPKRPFTVQLIENDLEFFERILSQNGIFYTFEQTPNGAKLWLLDDISDLPNFTDKQLNVIDESGQARSRECILSLVSRTQSMTDSVQYNTYHYHTPDKDLAAGSGNATLIAGKGQYYHFGRHYSSPSFGQWLTEIHQQALDCQREVTIAVTDCRGLQVGQKLVVANHPYPDYNGDYRIIAIDIEGEQQAGFTQGHQHQASLNRSKRTFENKVQLIRANTPYRDLPKPTPRNRDKYLNAVVTDEGGPYAFLDEQGRYLVKFPLDLVASHGPRSCRIRAAQAFTGPLSGNGAQGMHYPLREGTQVTVGFSHGDLDRPVILGMLANPEQPNPVTISNHSENLIRTWGGNELKFADQKNREQLLVATKNHLNRLKLNATEKQHAIELISQEGMIESNVKKNHTITSDGDQHVEAGEDYSINIGQNQKVLTEEESITQKTAQDIQYNAKQNIAYQTEQGNIGMDIAQDVQFETGKDFSLKIRKNNLLAQVLTGKIQFSHKRALSIEGSGKKDATIYQAKGSLTANASGNVSIIAPKITLSAPTINIHGGGSINSGAAVSSQLSSGDANKKSQDNSSSSADKKNNKSDDSGRQQQTKNSNQKPNTNNQTSQASNGSDLSPYPAVKAYLDKLEPMKLKSILTLSEILLK